MDSVTLVAIVTIVTAGLSMTVGAIAPALAEGRALQEALRSMARQPDEANTISRTLFVGLALVESTAIYVLVVVMILVFVNPFWGYITEVGG